MRQHQVTFTVTTTDDTDSSVVDDIITEGVHLVRAISDVGHGVDWETSTITVEEIEP